MATERDIELLDDYIANKLTGGEKEAFEQRLKSDQQLKSEFQLQQKLVEGIKNARAAELKTMLNNIPVSSIPTGQTLITKIATWTVVSGLVATGVYFFLNRKTETNSESKVIVENNKAVERAPEIQNTTKENSNTTTEQPIQQPEVKSKKTTEKTTASSTQGNAVTQRPNVFDPTAENETNSLPDQSQIDNTVDAKEEITVKPSTMQVGVVDEANKNYTFHYQFKNGKVLLYGSFERNLYEILEFFSGSKRTAFLYYKDNYYLISEDNDKIKPLVPINDPVLRNKLKAYQSK